MQVTIIANKGRWSGGGGGKGKGQMKDSPRVMKIFKSISKD